jgi:hypothetical protein
MLLDGRVSKTGSFACRRDFPPLAWQLKIHIARRTLKEFWVTPGPGAGRGEVDAVARAVVCLSESRAMIAAVTQHTSVVGAALIFSDRPIPIEKRGLTGRRRFYAVFGRQL